MKGRAWNVPISATETVGRIIVDHAPDPVDILEVYGRMCAFLGFPPADHVRIRKVGSGLEVCLLALPVALVEESERRAMVRRMWRLTSLITMICMQFDESMVNFIRDRRRHRNMLIAYPPFSLIRYIGTQAASAGAPAGSDDPQIGSVCIVCGYPFDAGARGIAICEAERYFDASADDLPSIIYIADPEALFSLTTMVWSHEMVQTTLDSCGVA